MVLRGRTYENVSRMAECSMANGACGTARKYVTLLERTLFHRGFARRCERLLADAKAGDEYFAPVRARLPTLDLPMTLRSFVPLLTLVESHPENRMAFDYLIAWCLLDEQALPMMPDYLGHLKEAGYAALPVHVQEALLSYEKWSGRAVEMPVFAYDPKIEARFSEFVEKVERAPSRTRRAARTGAVVRRHGHVLRPVPPAARPLQLWVGLLASGQRIPGVEHGR